MGKQLAVTVSAVHRVGTKMYLTANGVHRKVKKAYLTSGGVHKLCYEEGSAIGTMVISYTGAMQDAGIVSMTDGEYRLLTLTSSGTLTVDREVSAEFWMCGGGTGGQTFDPDSDIYGRGGCGAYAKNGSLTLSGSAVATVASRAGASSFGGLSTGTPSAGVDLANGGSGGGGTLDADPGNGDGISKYPFGDTSYFKPHCGGGGGGGYDNIHNSSYYYATHGGKGGTNGGNGGSCKSGGDGVAGTGGAGGKYGGGDGGDAGDNGNKASFYGSGGGGGGYRYDDDEGESYIGSGGVGYQGVIYIRIPVNQ